MMIIFFLSVTMATLPQPLSRAVLEMVGDHPQTELTLNTVSRPEAHPVHVDMQTNEIYRNRATARNDL